MIDGMVGFAEVKPDRIVEFVYHSKNHNNVERKAYVKGIVNNVTIGEHPSLEVNSFVYKPENILYFISTGG
jgi:hypothetical protein